MRGREEIVKAAVDPQGCAECGIPERRHARQAGSDGVHVWVRPSDALVKARMVARREETAAAVARDGALPMPVGPGPLKPKRQSRTMLDHARDALGARMAKDDLRLVLENTITYASSLETRVAELESLLAESMGQVAAADARLAEVEQTPFSLDADTDAPYVSRPLPPRDAVCARPGCGHSGAEHHHGDTKCWAHLPRVRQVDLTWSGIAICDCSGFVAGLDADASADRLTRLLAPTQTLRQDEAVRRSVDAQFPAVAAFLAETETETETEADGADRIVAYCNPSGPGVLCREHGGGRPGLTPLTSEDLPDGGICAVSECGVDVLAEEHKPGGAPC